jgi:hypothetical protein
MPRILDQMTVKRPLAWYRPTTARELFVLRLAQKLGEPAAIQHYAELASKYNDETLLLAYRKTLNHGHPPHDLARAFHTELAAARRQDDRSQTGGLMAIKVERRCIAVAVFVGTRLDFHDMRTLGANPDKADSSAIAFLRWVISSFDMESATMERMTNGDEIRRAVLNQVVIDMLRSSGLPIWELSKRDLLEAYGHPPLRNRGELRQAAATILWAMFNTDRPNCQELDAASIGLYVQTERQFYHS